VVKDRKKCLGSAISPLTSQQRLGQLGAGARQDHRGEHPGGHVGDWRAEREEGAVHELGAEGPVTALDHHVQHVAFAHEGAFLDDIAVEGGQVKVAAVDGVDAHLIVAPRCQDRSIEIVH
jgi:hypothetical protein